MHFFSHLSTNPVRGRNFLHCCFAQLIHGAELAQQQILPVLAYTGAIIEKALADPLFHEQLMISVGETMCFVADALKQAQGARIHRKLQRHRPVQPVNFFVFFRQADDRKIMQTQSLQLATRRGKLAFSSIDNDQVR